MFEEFYRAQGVCPEAEFQEMIEVLRTDLPASFRWEDYCKINRVWTILWLGKIW